jgi:hypothetical protein
VPTQSATRFLLAPISCRNEDHGNEGRALGSALRRACYALPSLSAAASGSVQLGASSLYEFSEFRPVLIPRARRAARASLRDCGMDCTQFAAGPLPEKGFRRRSGRTAGSTS